MRLIDKKVEHWKNQLLDLGKKNKMIHYRETKRTTLKILEPSIEQLFKQLVLEEKVLEFQKIATDIRVCSILSLLNNLNINIKVTVGDIKTEGDIIDVQFTLNQLRLKSKLAFEEQGNNVLYLSIGFIGWNDYKNRSTDKYRYSPLVLVPIKISMETTNSPYKIQKYDDEIVVNHTLQYYFKTEYGIELPDFNYENEKIEGYFEKIEDLTDKHNWKIKKDMSIGILSYTKITMYNDIIENEDRIKNHPVIKAMSGDIKEVNTIPEKLNNYDIDKIKPRECFQVMSADSSQQDAILYSKNNVSFVMQGPPGTGKTETAKTLAEILFGDESCCIRFDMSEYGQRRENVNSNMPYEEVSKNVRNAIEDYFKLQLGRPEILNRIGENIVVFDFIRPDIAKMILNSQLRKIMENLEMEKKIKLEISGTVKEILIEEMLKNLSNGGRGIGNLVENLFINPLSRYLFDNEIFGNEEIIVYEILIESKQAELKCIKKERE